MWRAAAFQAMTTKRRRGMSDLTVSVVIPAKNEADNLRHVLPRIPRDIYEVILVDGFSTDSTVDVARELRPDIRIVYEEGRGKGAALRTGFNTATGDIIVMLDADGSTDPAEIPVFVAALLIGADFVKGSRFIQGGGTADMTLFRKTGHAALMLVVKFLFGGNFSDLCYGYNAFWREVLPQLALDADGFEIETLMNVRALNAGLKIAEVPSYESERIYGLSNLRAIPDGWRILKTIFRERFQSGIGPARRGEARAQAAPLTQLLRGVTDSPASPKLSAMPARHWPSAP